MVILSLCSYRSHIILDDYPIPLFLQKPHSSWWLSYYCRNHIILNDYPISLFLQKPHNTLWLSYPCIPYTGATLFLMIIISLCSCKSLISLMIILSHYSCRRHIAFDDYPIPVFLQDPINAWCGLMSTLWKASSHNITFITVMYHTKHYEFTSEYSFTSKNFKILFLSTTLSFTLNMH